MKKIISVWLLMFLALGLCACSEASAGIAEAWESGLNGTGSLVVTTEKEEPAVVIPPTAIRLHVSFGPEFDVVMTDYLRILMINPANAEAETLLEGLELVDRSYCFAFDEVLAAAQEQGYLGVGKTIKMTADSLDASVWTNASKELLMRPVDEFRKETGALFGCHLFLPDAAKQIQLDFSLLTKVERTTEEAHEVFYPTGEISGHTTWRSVWTYPDGRITEWYAFDIRDGSATISCYPNGMWYYSQLKGNEINEIWEGPDSCGYREAKGSVDPNAGKFIFESASGFDSIDGGYYFEDTYNEQGIFASRTREYLDGSCETQSFYDNGELRTREYKGADGTYEAVTLYDNGELRTREYKDADGMYEAVAFYPNGQMESRKLETAEGYFEEQWMEDGKLVYQKLADAGMTNLREIFYTDGKPSKVIIDGVTYEDQQTLSQLG